MEVMNNVKVLGEYANEITIGAALARFLREIDTIESDIGDMVITPGKEQDALRVSGLMVDASDRCNLLSTTDISLDCTPKFNKAFNKSVIYILNNYIKECNCHDGKALRQGLKMLESNKLLVAPIKPRDAVEVELGNRKYVTSVHSIKWVNNKETKRLEYNIITERIPEIENKRVKLNIKDYGDKILLLDVERLENMDDDKRKSIHMTSYGIISTVVVNGGGDAFIVDNSYMYRLEANKAKIVGEWVGNKMVVDIKGNNKQDKSKALKYLENNIDYISKHRRYIAPYGLSDYNIITLG